MNDLIKNIEEGNKEAFKDVFYLKMFIKNYSKYLGLDYDEGVISKDEQRGKYGPYIQSQRKEHLDHKRLIL